MFTIQFNSSQGLCETLIKEIRNQIQNGKLKSNEKLPSKRSLAEHLGVSVITVQNAYSELISEGYIYSVEKKGFFVTDILNEQIDFTKSYGNPKATCGNPKATCDNPKDSCDKPKDCRDKPKDCCDKPKDSFFSDFSSNSTNPDKFPFSLWAHLTRKVLTDENLKSRLLERVNVKGVFELRKEIAKYLSDFRNMNVNPEQIVIGAGTESICSMIVQLLGNDKIYAVENPGYHKISKVFQANNANVVTVDIDESGMNISDLKKSDAKIVHISPSHHFPTGCIMPIRRRRELLSWADENDGYIIEDEYDSEFRFNGKPLPSLQSVDENGRVIYINTFSKTLTPSFRISYMILPLSLLNTFEEKLGFYSCSVSSFEQFTLASFIENGFYGKHIIRMKNYYRNFRNALVKAINESSIHTKAHIHEEDSGLHFLLEVNDNLNIDEIHQKLLENGINIPLLSDFSYKFDNSKMKNAFVLNYSGIEKEKIGEIVKRMEKAF